MPTEASGRRTDLLGFALAVVLATAATAVMDFRPALDLTKPGTDSSWMYSFNRASAERQQWGRDFISTYGPYGYLIVTHPVADLPARRVRFELARLVLAGLAIALYLHANAALGRAVRAPLAIVFAWLLALQTSEYRWFGVYLLLALASVHLESRAAAVARFAAGAAAGFLMLVKGSIGGGAVLATLALAAAGPLRAALPALALGAAGIACGLGAGWLAYAGRLEGLLTHLRLTAEIAGGYSAAMSLATEDGARDAAAFLAFVAMLLAAVAASGDPRLRRSLVACALPLFVVWKHAFVRQDPFHTGVVLPFGLLIVAVLAADAVRAPRRRWVAALLIVGVGLLVPVGARAVPRMTVIEQLVRPLSGDGWRYLRQIPELDAYQGKAWRMSRRLLDRLVLPAEVVREIGPATIDVYPRETAYAAANRELAWRIRPSPASFGDYRPVLDRLNADFYADAARPGYVLWHWDADQAIDGRNVLWDEPLTLRALFRGYDVFREDPFLLRARSEPRALEETPRGNARVDWEQWIDVPASNGPLLAHTTLAGSLTRTAVRVLFREDPLFMDLRLTSGEVLPYRFVPENAPSGLWIQPPLLGPPDVRRALGGEAPRRTVAAIRFRGPWATRRAGPIRVAWVEWRLR